MKGTKSDNTVLGYKRRLEKQYIFWYRARKEGYI